MTIVLQSSLKYSMKVFVVLELVVREVGTVNSRGALAIHGP